jgi:N-ethylmaleimide reductase
MSVAKKLFSQAKLGKQTLQNAVVMAPMTRSRCPDNVPGELVAEYYGQRAANCGLVITEGTSPSVNGTGYSRIPGIWNDAQIKGWKKVTTEIKARGGKACIQLMHCGRISHGDNLPAGGQVLAFSPVQAAGKMWSDKAMGLLDHPVPKEMTEAQIKQAIEEFKVAADNAISKAGFDFVELHSANGYLLNQSFAINTNIRKDSWGGSIENRSRFLSEVVDSTSKAVGGDRVGVRLSPFSTFNDIAVGDAETHKAEYRFLASLLGKKNLAYLHLIRGPGVPEDFLQEMRKLYNGNTILCGGYDDKTAEKDLVDGKADLIAFGRPLISNVDLLKRWQKGAPLVQADMSTLYTPGPKGYTDYKPMA